MKRSEITTIRDLTDATGLIQQEIADMIGVSKATMSQIANQKYNNWPAFVKVAVDKAIAAGKLVVEEEAGEGLLSTPLAKEEMITIDTSVFIPTDNVNALFSLCNDLLDGNTILNASIGMAVGRAGYGKTTAIRRFVSFNDDAVYILWMNYTKAQLFQRIAEELIGRSENSYYKNIKLICDVTSLYRKLIVIDEADRMPIQILEDLRTLNEEGTVPILLLGEESLSAKVKKADRIESRIRKPVVTFRQLDWKDLCAYYQQSTGLVLDRDVALRLVQDAHRDFRVAANDMQAIVKLMNANGVKALTKEALDAIRRAR